MDCTITMLLNIDDSNIYTRHPMSSKGFFKIEKITKRVLNYLSNLNTNKVTDYVLGVS